MDGTNYQLGELLEFMTPSPEDRGFELENIVLTASFRSEVIGFVLCHYYPAQRKAIISYLAIDSQCREARKNAAPRLLERLLNMLKDRRHRGEFLFFDVQGVDPNDPQLSRGERQTRNARPILFRRSARQLGYRADTFEFDYLCPKVTMDPEMREYSFTLMCVPIEKDLPNPIPKEMLLEFLRFVYKTCYGDVYPLGHPEHEAHLLYLEGMVVRYAERLPESIPLKW